MVCGCVCVFGCRSYESVWVFRCTLELARERIRSHDLHSLDHSTDHALDPHTAMTCKFHHEQTDIAWTIAPGERASVIHRLWSKRVMKCTREDGSQYVSEGECRTQRCALLLSVVPTPGPSFGWLERDQEQRARLLGSHTVEVAAHSPQRALRWERIPEGPDIRAHCG